MMIKRVQNTKFYATCVLLAVTVVGGQRAHCQVENAGSDNQLSTDYREMLLGLVEKLRTVESASSGIHTVITMSTTPPVSMSSAETSLGIENQPFIKEVHDWTQTIAGFYADRIHVGVAIQEWSVSDSPDLVKVWNGALWYVLDNTRNTIRIKPQPKRSIFADIINIFNMSNGRSFVANLKLSDIVNSYEFISIRVSDDIIFVRLAPPDINEVEVEISYLNNTQEFRLKTVSLFVYESGSQANSDSKRKLNMISELVVSDWVQFDKHWLPQKARRVVSDFRRQQIGETLFTRYVLTSTLDTSKSTEYALPAPYPGLKVTDERLRISYSIGSRELGIEGNILQTSTVLDQYVTTELPSLISPSQDAIKIAIPSEFNKSNNAWIVRMTWGVVTFCTILALFIIKRAWRLRSMANANGA